MRVKFNNSIYNVVKVDAFDETKLDIYVQNIDSLVNRLVVICGSKKFASDVFYALLQYGYYDLNNFRVEKVIRD